MADPIRCAKPADNAPELQTRRKENELASLVLHRTHAALFHHRGRVRGARPHPGHFQWAHLAGHHLHSAGVWAARLTLQRVLDIDGCAGRLLDRSVTFAIPRGDTVGGSDHVGSRTRVSNRTGSLTALAEGDGAANNVQSLQNAHRRNQVQ